MLKILIAHNHYQTIAPSGENIVFAAETELLRSKGHQVVTFEKHNDDLRNLSVPELAMSAGPNTIWSRKSANELHKLLLKEKPDVVHVHNTFPQISPSIYSTCKKRKVPVVLTLHNYRLFCSNGMLFRNGSICEECIEKSSIMGLKYKCYRDSSVFSAFLVSLQLIHNSINTYNNVDRFITLTDFQRQKMVDGGLQAEKISVKPNFIPPIGKLNFGGNGIIFVGRLDEMKGVRVLMNAAKHMHNIPVDIVGDGPLKPEVIEASKYNNMITYHGLLPREETIRKMSEARILVMPSIWYETFGLTTLEAFSVGTPVVASNHGCMAEIIEDGKTGMLFEPNNSKSLAKACESIYSDDIAIKQMGKAAHQTYIEKFTPDSNYEMLMDIYKSVI